MFIIGMVHKNAITYWDIIFFMGKEAKYQFFIPLSLERLNSSSFDLNVLENAEEIVVVNQTTALFDFYFALHDRVKKV